MAEADADFSTNDVSDVNESETGEAAADAAEAYSEAQAEAGKESTEANKAAAEAQRSSLNEAQAKLIGELAPEGTESTAVQEAATEVNEGVEGSTDLADAKNNGDTMDTKAKNDAAKQKANKALTDMQARLADFMKDGVNKTAEKTLSRQANTKWGELTETHEQALNKLGEALKNGTDKDIKDAQADADKTADAMDDFINDDANKDFKTELEASEGSIEWAKWGKMLAIIGGLGGLFAVCWKIAQEKTGCYIYIKGDKHKLDGFGAGGSGCAASDVQGDCACQPDTDSTSYAQICPSPSPGPNEKLPMCCAGNDQGQPPCNSTSDIKTTFYYGYNKYNALDVMAAPIAAIPKLLDGLAGGITGLFKIVLKWVLLAIAICAGVGLIWFFGKMIFMHFMTSSAEPPPEQPAYRQPVYQQPVYQQAPVQQPTQAPPMSNYDR